jgi:hypothetical protein
MKAVKWSNKTPWKDKLLISADSWPKFGFGNRPITIKEAEEEKNLIISPYGKYAYANVIVPAYSWVDNAYRNKRGKVAFDGDVIIPVLYGHEERSLSLFDGKVYSKRSVWMSHTVMEAFTLRDSLTFAKGRVLIAGLGLGWLAYEVSKKKSVKSIDLVEISKELVEFYGESIKKKANINNLIIENFYTFMESVKLTDYDSILVDIWQNYENARRDEELHQLIELGYPIKAWGIY